MNEINDNLTKYIEIEGINASSYAGKAVAAVKTKARGILGDDLLTFKLLDFISFMMLNNKFANLGIYVTDSNREESYIKIIETGDEQLLNDLEKYLILLDDIKQIEIKKEEYSKIINQLRSLHDHNDELLVNSIVEAYLRR
jgi:hypothetical protein